MAVTGRARMTDGAGSTKLNTHQNSGALINLKTTQIKMTKAGRLIKIIPIMTYTSMKTP